MRIHAPDLYQMVGIMMNWGERLQERYGDLSAALQEMAESRPESKLALGARDRFEATGGC